MEGGANFVVKVMLEAEAVARLMAFRNLAGYLALEGCRSPLSLQFLNLGGFGRPRPLRRRAVSS
jgi:hypothetical protein